jgi:hypothetical protein
MVESKRLGGHGLEMGGNNSNCLQAGAILVWAQARFFSELLVLNHVSITVR